MSLKAVFFVAIAGTILAGCAGGPFHASGVAGDLHDVEPGHGWGNVDRAYAKMDAQYIRNGRNRTPTQVRQLALGQSQEQVKAVLGDAVLQGDNTLYFNVNLPQTGKDDLVCQYAASFDNGVLVDGGWRRVQCSDLARS